MKWVREASTTSTCWLGDSTPNANQERISVPDLRSPDVPAPTAGTFDLSERVLTLFPIDKFISPYFSYSNLKATNFGKYFLSSMMIGFQVYLIFTHACLGTGQLKWIIPTHWANAYPGYTFCTVGFDVLLITCGLSSKLPKYRWPRQQRQLLDTSLVVR